jgi:hypothetical protein
MDQRGQAFSVFELMIAAIVAVAILFVLLPIISGGFSFNTTPGDAISNALSAVKDGGQTTSQEFSLEPNVIIKGTDFVSDGFDQRSIIVATAGDGKFPADRSTTDVQTSSGSGEDFSYFKYTGSTPQPAKAIVICEQTGDSLDDVIGISEDIVSGAEGLDTTICDGESVQPCCAVIIQRA